jgi:hypothetical protein
MPGAEGKALSAIKTKQVLKLVIKSPGATAKELTKAARARGLECTRSEVNSALYKLLARSDVIRAEPESGAAPQWHPASAEVAKSKQPTSPASATQTPERGKLRNLVSLAIDEGLELVLGECALSANDPYIEVEMLDERVVVTINISHPATIAGNADGESAADLFRVIAAVDALMLVRAQRSSQPLDGRALIEVRDVYLREIALRTKGFHC